VPLNQYLLYEVFKEAGSASNFMPYQTSERIMERSTFPFITEKDETTSTD
jgi:hypothetical protein